MLVGIASGESLVNVMSLLCREVEALASEVICSVMGIDDEGRLSFIAGPSLPEEFAWVNGVPIGPNAASCGTAIFRKQAVEVQDIESDPLWEEYRNLALPHGLRACWSSPILAPDGRVLGAFAFYFRKSRGASDLERLIVDKCVNICALAIESTDARSKLNELAFFDPLTGLGNRATLRKRLALLLQHAEERGRPVGLFHIDLADFRAVNDLHGHAVGDIVLRKVSDRLRSLADEADLIVRMGGDEFLVARTFEAEGADYEQFAAEIVARLSGRYEMVSGERVTIDAVVGVSKFPGDGKDQDRLLAHAETARRRVKRNGCGYAIFESGMQLEQHRLRVLQRDVGLAVDKGELSVVFQPQIDVKTGSVGGFEALLRWNHPEHGPVSPADFIPAAEASGAILKMGAFVLREACREAAKWKAKLRVAVNVSAAQIVESDLAKLVKDVLSETGLEAERLEVEVTESLFIQDMATAKMTLREIKDLGVSVAIDDFGTGFSSLSTLRAFPFDRLKVDRSFVSDMVKNSDAAAIVNSVIGLGRAMGLRVVAEGVECDEQVAMLKLLRCHEVQGYLFGKPLPIEAYAHLTGPKSPRTFSSALPKLRDM
ncbi:putative bifunctional diguanylate cyclase/phosphodiesterase [Hyphomicrobium sp.]|uniref:putative bifunctional diguanylate cyclase/phosphodiesterase n=1 Tax=Hyphomicrobium sp. TaxID=82 RepID=UPI002D78C852|nr:EAL domain-containing protein [Hyphomicrobium sp.]HET6388441.1 EAL domain-containing protein [Hyphomicrobium sp.]